MGDFGSQEREEREGSDELGEDLRRGEIGVCGMRGGHRSGRGGTGAGHRACPESDLVGYRQGWSSMQNQGGSAAKSLKEITISWALQGKSLKEIGWNTDLGSFERKQRKNPHGEGRLLRKQREPLANLRAMVGQFSVLWMVGEV